MARGDYMGMFDIDGNARTSRGESRGTHRPLDEKHGDRPDDRHVPNQRLQDHPHHPVELQTQERTARW